jgi:hypothetical protein
MVVFSLFVLVTMAFADLHTQEPFKAGHHTSLFLPRSDGEFLSWACQVRRRRCPDLTRGPCDITAGLSTPSGPADDTQDSRYWALRILGARRAVAGVWVPAAEAGACVHARCCSVPQGHFRKGASYRNVQKGCLVSFKQIFPTPARTLKTWRTPAGLPGG